MGLTHLALNVIEGQHTVGISALSLYCCCTLSRCGWTETWAHNTNRTPKSCCCCRRHTLPIPGIHSPRFFKLKITIIFFVFPKIRWKEKLWKKNNYSHFPLFMIISIYVVSFFVFIYLFIYFWWSNSTILWINNESSLFFRLHVT